MEIKITTYIDNMDIKTYEEITSAPEFEEELKKLPNLAEREEIKCKDTKRYTEREVRYFAIGFIPLAVRSFLKPKMLTWIEKSIYDKEKHFFEWEVIPFYFKNMVDCRGKFSLFEEGKKLRREVSGCLKISVPVIGPLAEKVIIENLKKNIEVEHKLTSRLIKKLRGRR